MDSKKLRRAASQARKQSRDLTHWDDRTITSSILYNQSLLLDIRADLLESQRILAAGWSKKKPNKEGYFFYCRNIESSPILTRIFAVRTGHLWAETAAHSIGLEAVIGGYWYPIATPPEIV